MPCALSASLLLAPAADAAPVWDPPICKKKLATVVAKVGKKTRGTRKADVIWGTKADDVIDGRGGDDLICGRHGDDTLRGGDGDDEIAGSFGDDHVVGQNGNDYMSGESGDDYHEGGKGNDVIVDESGFFNEFDGGKGNDEIGGGGYATVLGGAGNDEITTGAGLDTVNGEDGNDRIETGSGGDDVQGGAGNDVLNGGADSDSLSGGSGSDTIFGDSGDDRIKGNEGEDLCYGEAGEDSCDGGAPGDPEANTPGDPDECVAETKLSCKGGATPDGYEGTANTVTHYENGLSQTFDSTVTFDRFQDSTRVYYGATGGTMDWTLSGVTANGCTFEGAHSFGVYQGPAAPASVIRPIDPGFEFTPHERYSIQGTKTGGTYPNSATKTCPPDGPVSLPSYGYDYTSWLTTDWSREEWKVEPDGGLQGAYEESHFTQGHGTPYLVISTEWDLEPVFE